jgi:predicted metal-dependent hydrolase
MRRPPRAIHRGRRDHPRRPARGLESRLRRWLEREALALLADDLAHYCARGGHPVPRLALSRAQRRWGSCAADGSIRINWRLVMAPDFVRRSVVAHEVAHLRHFDHSPAFHAELDRLFEGSIAEANHWLKREGRGLYRPFG